MKILLIGEFSGVHNNLKKGLAYFGHEVILAADGDGYRGFDYDIKLTPYKGFFGGKIKNIFYFLFSLRKFIGYDVIQFINPFSLPYYYYFVGITSILFKYNNKIIYYACGTDPAFIASRDKFEYFPFSEENSTEIPHYNKLKQKYYSWFINNISSIIPSMYTYGLGYFGNPKLSDPIPMPNSGNYGISNPNQKDVGKLKILFGITRKEFKGADFILKALEKIQGIYSEGVEITIVEKLPFEEYLDLLRQTDVLIDQCKSYDYGMNAIFALENGVIVFSGAEPIAMKYLSIQDNPVINIKPDSKQIFEQIKSLIKANDFSVLKKKSLEYAKNIHDVYIIAQRFLEYYDEIV